MLLMQPRMSGSGNGKSLDEVVCDSAQEILDRIADPLSIDEDDTGIFSTSTTTSIKCNGHQDSLAIILSQEMTRFNK